MNLHIAIEANAGQGQDAAVYGKRYAFVFDGLGGTGGKSREHRDGRKWKEAKIAARAAAQAVGQAIEQEWEKWAQLLGNASKAEAEQVLEKIRTELKWAIDAALQQAAREWKADTLPATAAGWITFPQPDGNTLAVAVWAGDSRCYTMDDQEMKLCTLDDVDEKYREDAMEELLGSGSPPMNNRVGINYDYHLNALARRINRRTLLVCCTDGIYGGMPTPMHMEYYLRLLTDAESFEDMAEMWEEFFVGKGLLQDDAATLETLYIDAAADADDSEKRVQAIRELLESRIEDLEKQYIKTFPEHITDETVDVDGQIGSLARQMCKRSFHARLRKNAVEIVKKGKEFPNDLPCASVLRQMQDDYRDMIEEKRVELRKKVQKAQVELDEYVAELDVGEYEAKTEVLRMSSEAEQMVQRGRFANFLDHTNERFKKIIEYMCGEYSNDFGYGMKRSVGGFDVRAIKDLDDVMKDMCIFINNHFNLANKMEAGPWLKMTRTGKASAQRKKGALSADDQNDLKLTVRMMVESGEAMEEDLFKNKSWPVAVVANVVMLTQKLIQAERELARFERNPSSDGELSIATLDDYLKSHPNSDARYFIEDWVNEKRKPAYFSLGEKDLLTIGREVDALIRALNENEKIRQRYSERKQQIIDLWAQYKPEYEAWDEQLEELVIAVEEKPQEPEEVQGAEAETAPSGQAQQDDAAAVPEKESEQEAVPQGDEEQSPAEEAAAEEAQTAAEDEEWTDCDSTHIHE